VQAQNVKSTGDTITRGE